MSILMRLFDYNETKDLIIYINPIYEHTNETKDLIIYINPSMSILMRLKI